MNTRTFERTWVQHETHQKPDELYNYAFQGEAFADTFIIDGKTKTGDPVQITGTITGVYLGENKVSVPLTGAVSNGKAVVTLDAACYTIPGKFTVSIYAQNDDERICIYCGIGYMFRTQSELIANSTVAIPDIMAALESLSDHFTEAGRFMLGTGNASADYAIAAGVKSIASGLYSLAQGCQYFYRSGGIARIIPATASGDASVSIGQATESEGFASQAFGKGTIANHKAQHVFGEFNEIDQSVEESTDRGTYVEIVGNGTDINDRSNARTLDWNGNEEIAGDITINKGTENEITIGAAIYALRQAIIALGGSL